MKPYLGRSRFQHTPDPLGPVASALAHVLIIGALTVTHSTVNERFDSEETVPEGLTFLVPPSASPASSVAQVRFEQEGGEGGDVRDGVDGENGRQRAGDRGANDPSMRAVANSDLTADALSDGASERLADAFQVIEVDSAAVPDSTSAAPAYPPELRRLGVEGWAAVRFVVDSTGRVDMTTVQSMGFTAPEFHRAVREAMPAMKFRPAMMNGKPVRQLAEQLFTFKIQRTTEPPG